MSGRQNLYYFNSVIVLKEVQSFIPGVSNVEVFDTHRPSLVMKTPKCCIKFWPQYRTMLHVPIFSWRFLVAIDRRNGTEVAMETVKLAEEFMQSTDGLVLGLDLSGDPTVSQYYVIYVQSETIGKRVGFLISPAD